MIDALSQFKLDIKIPEVAVLPDVGDIVTTPDGHRVRVTACNPVSDFFVLVGKLAPPVRNRQDACWMLRRV